MTGPEKLWPILPPDDRFPFPPAIWLVVNMLLALVVALPFLFVAGAAAACLWLVDAMRVLLVAHAGGGMLLLAIASFLKVSAILFAVRMEYLMFVSGGVRYLIREARCALREFDPSRL